MGRLAQRQTGKARGWMAIMPSSVREYPISGKKSLDNPAWGSANQMSAHDYDATEHPVDWLEAVIFIAGVLCLYVLSFSFRHWIATALMGLSCFIYLLRAPRKATRNMIGNQCLCIGGMVLLLLYLIVPLPTFLSFNQLKNLDEEEAIGYCALIAGTAFFCGLFLTGWRIMRAVLLSIRAR